jgi:beta-galactosidase
MESVTVPHDWAIYGPLIQTYRKLPLFKWRKCSYRKIGRTGATYWHCVVSQYFTLPKDTKAKNTIAFEGAMSEPQVYLNGKRENGRAIILFLF